MRCLVVDSHPVTLLGYRSLLQSNFPDWQILTATNLQEAALQISDTSDGYVDIVLFDLIINSESGVTFLSRLRSATRRHPAVVVVSASSDPRAAAVCKRLGTDAFVSKESSPEEIVGALRCVGSGQTCFRPPGDSPGETRTAYPTLTSRQRDLVDLLLIGCSNKVIASTLNLSYGTVKNYMFDLMRLLSVRSRLELVAKIREGGLLLHSDAAAGLPGAHSLASDSERDEPPARYTPRAEAPRRPTPCPAPGNRHALQTA